MSEYYQPICIGRPCGCFYKDGGIHKGPPPPAARTWGITPGKTSAFVYGQGRSLSEHCPPPLKEEWEASQAKIKTFFLAFCEAKINIKEHCLTGLIPAVELLKFYGCKDEITQHVFQSMEPPLSYDFLVTLHDLLQAIASRPLIIDERALDSQQHQPRVKGFWGQVRKSKPYMIFDMFKSKTGRLTTCRGSFPILTMAKKYRKVLKPHNDHFIEFDYNAAELRTLLALADQPQPPQDLHTWNIKNVYRGLLTREQAKKRIFEWLYNPESKDHLSEGVYKKEEIKNKYYKNGVVTNPFGREIKCDDFHALNYLIQSTAADIFLRQVVKINEIIKKKELKSFISFLMHDSIVLDVCEKETSIIKELAQGFSNTKFGTFPVTTKRGTDYGNLKEE